MEFIDKFAKIDGSDNDDIVMPAGGDEVNHSDVESVVDGTKVQDQTPSDYRTTNVTMYLQKDLQDQSMSANLDECPDSENFVSNHVEEIEYEIDELDEQDLKTFA